MHTLDITYKNTYNCTTLRIEDNSVYDTLLPIEDAILEIKVPGQKCFLFFNDPFPCKSITLDCKALQLCCSGESCTDPDCVLTALPDGVYQLKYSVNPHSKYMVEFDHMRICQLMAQYIKATGLFLSKKCEMDRKDSDKIEKELLDIKDTIDASVYAVEECLDRELGIDLYKEALKKIKKITDGNFANCCK